MIKNISLFGFLFYSLNNNNNNNINNNNNNNNNNRAEWKIQLQCKIVAFLLKVLKKPTLYTQK